MTDHAPTCQQPPPHVQHLVVADAAYALVTCTECGAQTFTRTEETK